MRGRIRNALRAIKIKLVLGLAMAVLVSPVGAEFIGDVNNDGRIGLDDAINAMQVVAGQRSATPISPVTVYVSVNGSDTPTGGLSPLDPVKSITYAMSRAVSEVRREVRVAAGLYMESIQLTEGIDLLGCYGLDFKTRSIDPSATILRAAPGQTYTVKAQNIASPTLMEGFLIEGPTLFVGAANSIAVHIVSCTDALTLRNNLVFAGRGADGVSGPPGTNGASGIDGRDGLPAIIAATSPCTETRLPNNAGALIAPGGISISGGNGGGNTCPPEGDTESSGEDGESGYAGVAPTHGNGGVGGDAGNDGRIDGTCYLPGNPMTGADGGSGEDGQDGLSGSGGSSSGTIVGGLWTGSSGASGDSGGAGGAGGHGGHGGGGGGGAGGASIGILVAGSVLPPSYASANTLHVDRASGGSGGSGGISYGGSGLVGEDGLVQPTLEVP